MIVRLTKRWDASIWYTWKGFTKTIDIWMKPFVKSIKSAISYCVTVNPIQCGGSCVGFEGMQLSAIRITIKDIFWNVRYEKPSSSQSWVNWTKINPNVIGKNRPDSKLNEFTVALPLKASCGNDRCFSLSISPIWHHLPSIENGLKVMEHILCSFPLHMWQTKIVTDSLPFQNSIYWAICYNWNSAMV